MSCQLWVPGWSWHQALYGGLRKGRDHQLPQRVSAVTQPPQWQLCWEKGRPEDNRRGTSGLKSDSKFGKTFHTPQSSSHLYAQYTVCWVLPCPISCNQANCEKRKASERVKMKKLKEKEQASSMGPWLNSCAIQVHWGWKDRKKADASMLRNLKETTKCHTLLRDTRYHCYWRTVSLETWA